jgi:hypothetical protein
MNILTITPRRPRDMGLAGKTGGAKTKKKTSCGYTALNNAMG